MAGTSTLAGLTASTFYFFADGARAGAFFVAALFLPAVVLAVVFLADLLAPFLSFLASSFAPFLPLDLDLSADFEPFAPLPVYLAADLEVFALSVSFLPFFDSVLGLVLGLVASSALTLASYAIFSFSYLALS